MICVVPGCEQIRPPSRAVSGLCAAHHMIGIRHRLIHPKLPAAPSAIRVLVDIDQAERCRREHADLQRPDPVRDQLRERLLQADRRIEEQAEEIGALRDRVTELAGLHLQATAREDELQDRNTDAYETLGGELLKMDDAVKAAAKREAALSVRIEELERAALQAAIVREEELARVLLSLEQAKEREAALITRIGEEQLVAAETAREEAVKWIARVEELEARLVSAERLVATERAKAREAALITRIGEREDELRARIEELETQLVSAERRVKGAEAEAATLRKLKGGPPADNFNRRPPDNGRRML